MKNKIIIIGGAGFIGTNAVFSFVKKKYKILVLDSLGYAGNLRNINKLVKSKLINFKKCDISNYLRLKKIIFEYKPNLILNFAAESHVDRSIDNPNIFFNSNILGVYNLVEIIRDYNKKNKININFFQVSTDEVYGSVIKGSSSEKSFINPSSPYSASKAASDAIVQGWCKTYNINYYISRCTNNYGPYQYPEKLIPITLYRCLNDLDIQIYGNGKNIRDWIYVDDHINGIQQIIENGEPNNIYNIGAHNEISNLDIINNIISILKSLQKNNFIDNFSSKIKYVNDRPAHDIRYSLNTKKIKNITKWNIKSNFKKRLKETVVWYITNKQWSKLVLRDKTVLNRIGL